MRRMSRETLRTNICVALSVLKPYKSRTLSLNIEHIRNEVVDDLINRIMGHPESEAVILQPDMVGTIHSPAIGRWDIDEPHPCPDLEAR